MKINEILEKYHDEMQADMIEIFFVNEMIL